ncbi:RNA polymerase sigma factor [Spongiimicrobium sp. 3-5]|uniref:RNA polymerase sigma factor n=1 Tax=Spongiimicrobium sp. 3-5 TaxID=3332596 RepID=UPI00397F5FE5
MSHLVNSRSNSKLEKEGDFRTLTDEELVQKIVKSRDSFLFGELYDRYAKVVFNKCSDFARSRNEAEDLTQDVFLMLFIKLASFKGRSKFSSWLYSFTYNFCVNYVNRNKERKISDYAGSIDDNDTALLVEVKDENLFKMRSDKLRKALNRIEPEDKSLLLLKYQDDVSIKELTNLLDLGESAVKMRLKRAKTRIIQTYNNLP